MNIVTFFVCSMVFPSTNDVYLWYDVLVLFMELNFAVFQLLSLFKINIEVLIDIQ